MEVGGGSDAEERRKKRAREEGEDRQPSNAAKGSREGAPGETQDDGDTQRDAGITQRETL